MRFLIVDDHPVVRKGLKQILLDYENTTLVDEASSGQEALIKVCNNDYDAVLLDISMPGTGGLEALKQIKQKKPRLPVLMLSIHPEEQYAIRAIKTGASGYLTKDSAPSELINALLKVCRGQKYITASVAEKLAVAIETDYEKSLHTLLSNREFQVMCLIAKGHTIKQISDTMMISSKTVSTYRERILLKMNMKTNAEINHYAFTNNLID